MPLLAAFIGSAFTAIFAFFTAMVGKKLAFALAMIALTVAAFAGMFAAISAVISGISVVVPSFVAVPASWILPGNITACVTARLTASIAIFAYRWHKDVIAVASAA